LFLAPPLLARGFGALLAKRSARFFGEMRHGSLSLSGGRRLLDVSPRRRSLFP
jgi:hypothetical protein